MLVVGHEHHAVGDRAEAREVVGAVPGGHVDGDGAARGVERGPQRRGEGDEAGGVLGGERFEVDVDAVGAERDHPRGEGGGEAGARGLVGEEGGGLGAGPAVAVEVGDARDDLDSGAAEQRAGGRVDRLAELAAGARDAEPVGRDGGHLVHVFAHRRVGRRVVDGEQEARVGGERERGAGDGRGDGAGARVERPEERGVVVRWGGGRWRDLVTRGYRRAGDRERLRGRQRAPRSNRRESDGVEGAGQREEERDSDGEALEQATA